MKAHASENKPHVIPLSVYLGIGGALLVLTAVTILVAQYNLGEWNIVIALLIAGTKATLVAFVFMHLFYDNKLYFMVFVGAIAFLVLFIGLSMIDTMERGDIYQEVARPIKPQLFQYAAPTHGEEGHMGMPDSTGHAMPDSMMHADSTAAPDSTSHTDSTSGTSMH